MSLLARFAFAAAIVIPAAVIAFLQIIDPSISNGLTGIGHAVVDAFTNIAAILSAHPVETVVVLGTAFPIDPLDRVMTLREWRTLRRISASTERRMRKAGLGPKLINISAGQLGVRVRDDVEWMERGGASVASANPPTRNSGRDTAKATAASVAKRAQRKAAAAQAPTTAPKEAFPKSPSAPAEPRQHAQPVSTAEPVA
jgi:hypothetical protein